jgi:hypothetical protein
MLYSSLAYAGRGALLGLAVMLAGLPLLAFARSRQPSPEPSLPLPFPEVRHGPPDVP